jgi:hypothetical protein
VKKHPESKILKWMGKFLIRLFDPAQNGHYFAGFCMDSSTSLIWGIVM